MHWKVTFSSGAAEDYHTTMTQWVPGGCVSAGDVGGCYVLWNSGTQAVGLGRAPVHCRWGCGLSEVAHRHRCASNAPATSSLLQVIVQTQGSALWRIFHDPHCWLAGWIPSHARQCVAIVARHHRDLFAIVCALRHVSSCFVSISSFRLYYGPQWITQIHLPSLISPKTFQLKRYCDDITVRKLSLRCVRRVTQFYCKIIYRLGHRLTDYI
jgi:hypothetical protein